MKFYKILQNFPIVDSVNFLPVFVEFYNFSLSLMPIQIFFAAFQSLLNLRNFGLLIQVMSRDKKINITVT